MATISLVTSPTTYSEYPGWFVVVFGWLMALALLLTLAVFPANVYMAQNPEQFSDFAPWLLYARLPLQLLILLWIAYAMRRARSGYGDFY
mgnify:CR=1 FL=1